MKKPLVQLYTETLCRLWKAKGQIARLETENERLKEENRRLSLHASASKEAGRELYRT